MDRHIDEFVREHGTWKIARRRGLLDVGRADEAMKVIALFRRKPGTTFEQFRDYYETHHSVLSREPMPFFSDYRRNYIRHSLGQQYASAEAYSATLDWDMITEITFASREDHDAMLRALAAPAVRKRIVEDEARFIDRSATLSYVVEESVSSIPGPAR